MKLARDAGWIAFKMDGNNDWPDYLFLTGSKVTPTLLVEFKRPGGELRSGQAAVQSLAYLKYHVQVLHCDTLNKFRSIVTNVQGNRQGLKR